MSHVLLIVDDLVVLAMVGVSVHGGLTLPPTARVPVHFGPLGYNRWLPRTAGLVLWPAVGVAVLAVAIGIARSRPDGGSGPPVPFTVAFVVMLVSQLGALRVARTRGHRD